MIGAAAWPLALPARPEEYNLGMAGKRGKFLGMPYDWRRPTKERFKSNAWDREGKVFTPHTVGWGYGINFRALWNRLTGR
jgi:hypothetical protein